MLFQTCQWVRAWPKGEWSNFLWRECWGCWCDGGLNHAFLKYRTYLTLRSSIGLPKYAETFPRSHSISTKVSWVIPECDIYPLSDWLQQPLKDICGPWGWLPCLFIPYRTAATEENREWGGNKCQRIHWGDAQTASKWGGWMTQELGKGTPAWLLPVPKWWMGLCHVTWGQSRTNRLSTWWTHTHQHWLTGRFESIWKPKRTMIGWILAVICVCVLCMYSVCTRKQAKKSKKSNYPGCGEPCQIPCTPSLSHLGLLHLCVCVCVCVC